MRSLETTARIQREHLRELLDLEEPAPRQRTTARMPAMTLTNLLTLRDDELPPAPEPVVVRFHTPGPLHMFEAWPRSLVVAVSFSATLLLLTLLARLL
jgi:hypothetical protein